MSDPKTTMASWIASKVVDDATGRTVTSLPIRPEGRFWLGTLAPEELQLRLDRGDRGERLDPCAVGLRVQPIGVGPWTFEIELRAALWSVADEIWSKQPLEPLRAELTVAGDADLLMTDIDRWLQTDGTELHRGAIRCELVPGLESPSLDVTFVNLSDESISGFDSRFYEVELGLRPISPTEPFLLESLPDSFRHDRRVPAYGINSGARAEGDWIWTDDAPVASQHRPSFWNADGDPPDLSFETLSTDPLPALSVLVEAHARWGEHSWSDEALEARAAEQNWTPEMWEAAHGGRAEFEEEQARLAGGLDALRSNEPLRLAFMRMNEALAHSAGGKYSGWRPFQIGFVLATCPAVADPTAESDWADIVWFATGGGKTETYLGLVCMAALYDRATGKTAGVTAWSRFPLRLLSLQQTQRFADAMAGAELSRRRHDLGGSPFSMGFLIGAGSTPNRIPLDPEHDWEPDPEDDDMPDRYRVLLRCPFCGQDEIEMEFDHLAWRLDHRCANQSCEWGDDRLPFHVVDDEIYRFLPTVVVGTLDKIASLSLQASMTGLVGPPRGRCEEPSHGFTYAKRSTRPKGCLVPGCARATHAFEMESDRFGPTFRLQDELHLLRDALGAVDAHYEALADHLQRELTGTKAKILGSSATLSGFERQVDVLYQRKARVFPAQGPSTDAGFWTAASAETARTHVALAPRGATMEFANDRIVTVVQGAVRDMLADPVGMAAEIGVDEADIPELVDLYGTTVVYGNTIRDLDAAARSLETQIPVDPPPTSATLTGQTPFEEVRATLDRLQEPEDDFVERLHVITASSMMSHGVDIDRLNVMSILGLPLTAAEYIQTTARVGRTHPGVVFVLHRMARERDAATYRMWSSFVTQGDRFVEPIPITRRSRRVLERTLPGLLQARLLQVHERRSPDPLTTLKNLGGYRAAFTFEAESEAAAIVELLGADGELDGGLRDEVAKWMTEYFDRLDDPPDGARFPGQLLEGRPVMRSLRDVDAQVPVRSAWRG